MPSTTAKCEAPREVLVPPKKSQARLARVPWRRRRAPKPSRNVWRCLPRRRCVTRQAAFLAAYRKTASIAAAAQAAGIKPAQHYQWIAASAAYGEAFSAVQEAVTGRLQDKVVELAMDGWAEPVFYRGRVCGTIQHHSDRLLIFFLEAAKPEKWRRLRSRITVGMEASSGYGMPNSR
jgi:hypothetical protein